MYMACVKDTFKPAELSAAYICFKVLVTGSPSGASSWKLRERATCESEIRRAERSTRRQTR